MSSVVHGGPKGPGLEDLEKGYLSRIAGKAFTILSAAAIALPLLGVAQGIGLMPGDMYSDTYVDVGH